MTRLSVGPMTAKASWCFARQISPSKYSRASSSTRTFLRLFGSSTCTTSTKKRRRRSSTALSTRSLWRTRSICLRRSSARSLWMFRSLLTKAHHNRKKSISHHCETSTLSPRKRTWMRLRKTFQAKWNRCRAGWRTWRAGFNSLRKKTARHRCIIVRSIMICWRRASGKRRSRVSFYWL